MDAPASLAPELEAVASEIERLYPMTTRDEDDVLQPTTHETWVSQLRSHRCPSPGEVVELPEVLQRVARAADQLHAVGDLPNKALSGFLLRSALILRKAIRSYAPQPQQPPDHAVLQRLLAEVERDERQNLIAMLRMFLNQCSEPTGAKVVEAWEADADAQGFCLSEARAFLDHIVRAEVPPLGEDPSSEAVANAALAPLAPELADALQNPQAAKVRELIVYLVQQLQDSRDGASIEKLRHVLMRADFAAYRAIGKSITGGTWVKTEHGPELRLDSGRVVFGPEPLAPVAPEQMPPLLREWLRDEQPSIFTREDWRRLGAFLALAGFCARGSNDDLPVAVGDAALGLVNEVLATLDRAPTLATDPAPATPGWGTAPNTSGTGGGR